MNMGAPLVDSSQVARQRSSPVFCPHSAPYSLSVSHSLQYKLVRSRRCLVSLQVSLSRPCLRHCIRPAAAAAATTMEDENIFACLGDFAIESAPSDYDFYDHFHGLDYFLGIRTEIAPPVVLQPVTLSSGEEASAGQHFSSYLQQEPTSSSEAAWAHQQVVSRCSESRRAIHAHQCWRRLSAHNASTTAH